MEQKTAANWLSLANPAGATFWLVALTTAARLVIAAQTGLGFGESYYALGVLHPDWSYFDQPPLSFWIARLSFLALGDFSPLAMRLPSVLLFAGSCGLLFCLARKLFGARAGFYAVLAMNLSAVFSLTGAIWLQPDAELMFFWLATACCIAQIFFRTYKNDDERRAWRGSAACWGWWILAGVLLGLTTLSKYHAAFLFAGVGLFALTRREDRHWIVHPGPYAALLINGLMALPVLLWNAQNGWASFLFQAGRAAGEQELQLHPGWVLQSVIGQALWLLPWIWVPLMYVLYRCFRAGRADAARWFCACTAVLPIAFFTLVTLWSNLGFHFHWQAPGYLMLFPALGALAAELIAAGGGWRRWILRGAWASAVLTVLTLSVLLVHMMTGFWSAYGPKWVGQLLGERDDPTMEGYDYAEVRERFEREGWLRNPQVFACADRWHLAGKVGWALHGEKSVVCFHWDPRNIAFFTDQRELIGQDAVLLSREDPQWSMQQLRDQFESIEQLPSVWITRGGVREIELYVYYARNFRKPFALSYGKNVTAVAR